MAQWNMLGHVSVSRESENCCRSTHHQDRRAKRKDVVGDYGNQYSGHSRKCRPHHGFALTNCVYEPRGWNVGQERAEHHETRNQTGGGQICPQALGARRNYRD
jgi:hypothetical protein